MDIRPNIDGKKIAKVVALHLTEPGYGPDGKQTREGWQFECRKNLLAGRQVFEDWQKSLGKRIKKELPSKSFAYELIFDDGSKLHVPEPFQILQFCYPLDFVAQEFNDYVDFRAYKFVQPALFAASIFRNIVNFSHANFKYDSNFSHTVFYKSAHFDNTKYQDYIYFKNSCFFEMADYQKSVFDKNMYFSDSKFLKNIFFSESHIKGDALFNSITFAGRAFFRKVIFENQCRFDNNVGSDIDATQKTFFGSNAEFENAVFNNIGHFERVVFLKHFPAFRGCRIDSTRIEFSEETSFPKAIYSIETLRDVSFLKKISDEQGQVDQALQFNAIELNLKRSQARIKIEPLTRLQKISNSDFWLANATVLYDKLSDYGRSFTKPLFWYGVLICLSGLFAMIYSTYSDSPVKERQVLCKQLDGQPPPLKLPYGRAVVEYAMFRAGGLMDFTDTGKQNNAVNCRLFEEPIEPPLMRAWGIFKGIASIALLFLAALGLRNKYRIK